MELITLPKASILDFITATNILAEILAEMPPLTQLQVDRLNYADKCISSATDMITKYSN